MGILQSDVLIRTAVEHTINEMRKNPWLIDDVFSELVTDPLLNEIYGQKEINNAKEWFLNNKIEVLLKNRIDSQHIPCVTIALGESREDEGESTLADGSTHVDTLTPSRIGKPIAYIIKPFAPVGYDKDTGVLQLPENADISLVSAGMLVFDVQSGNAYPILDKQAPNSVVIAAGTELTLSECGILPQFMVWKARRERASFRESYTIGCHVSGDPSTLLWLHSIVKYGLLRYRETLFEARNFQISSIRSTDMMRNGQFDMGADNVYSRWITISGLVENDWLKSPKRVIETIRVKDPTMEPDTGIKICSNLDSVIEIVDPEKDDAWVTVKMKNGKKNTLSRK